MKVLRVLAIIIYIVVAIVQMAAIITGVTNTLGFFGILLGVLLGPIPLVGTIMGIIGAVNVWGWSVGLSLLLFAAPIITSITIGLLTRER